MRNLKEYPITNEEKLALVERLEKEYDPQGAIGDMTPLLLREIAEDLHRLYDLLDS